MKGRIRNIWIVNNMNIYAEILHTIETDDQAVLVTTLNPDNTIDKQIVTRAALPDLSTCSELAARTFSEGCPVLQKTERVTVFSEPFRKEERMIILGGGHVSLALAEFASRIGFSVTVVDDRPFFANKIRFPFAHEVICDSFVSAIPRLGIHSFDYVVLVTRGHKHDGDCLRTLFREKEPYYIGMIGSRRRVAGLKDALEEEGISRDWLEKIHTPIGLKIGAVTPEEISISILAEVIREKRMPSPDKARTFFTDIDMEVLHKLACIPENRKNQKKAIVTIASTKGSVPRKAGAKMIVYEDGFTEGTVGGGCAEAELAGVARQIIKTGGWTIKNIDLTNDMAGEEGMVCGGTMEMLVEAVEQIN